MFDLPKESPKREIAAMKQGLQHGQDELHGPPVVALRHPFFSLEIMNYII